MSNTSFRVDLAELGALRHALVRAEQTVRNAVGALGAADTAAPGDAPGSADPASGTVIGTADLDRACTELLGHWSAVLGDLGRQLEQTAEGVTTAARNYSGTESRLAAALRSAAPGEPRGPLAPEARR
ncbi:hypothetical protein [Streptacidiphilus albus]|uniref:hypothetical protein n=1 Tax=Streptacidiphilus albus TaxID=105425 RepID=UPI00054BAD5C|nr:hypothetical protein [Streptacidiphilus albus]